MQRAGRTMSILLLGCLAAACTMEKRDAGTNQPAQMAEAAAQSDGPLSPSEESDIESRGLGDRLPIVTAPRIYPPHPNGAFACLQDQGTPLSSSSLLALPPDLTLRNLSGSVSSSMKMTNDQCRANCATQGFQYAGTQSGAFCFCGHSYKGQASSACTAGCLGYPGEVCGGQLANSISYSGAPFTALPAPPMIPSPP